MRHTEIILYGRERHSPDVQRTRERLLSLGLPFIEHDIETDEAAGDELEGLTGMRRVPTIVLGHRVLIEPSDDELLAALRDVGDDV